MAFPQPRPVTPPAPRRPVVTLDSWRKVEAAATLQEILRDHGREWLLITVLELVKSEELR